MNRAERRHQLDRIKQRTVFRALNVNHMGEVSPSWIGRTAAVHWTCMCWMCKPEMRKRKPGAMLRHIDDWNAA